MGGSKTRTRTRSINAPACPTRVQTARFARSIPAIARVLSDCSTVQETALLVVGSEAQPSELNIRDMHEGRSVAKLVIHNNTMYCYRMLR